MTVRGVRWAAATANKRLWALVDAPPPVRRGALLTAVCGGGGDRPWRGCEELTAATAWRAVCAVCRLATPPHPPLSSTFPPPGGVAPLLLPRDGGPFAVGRCSADDYHPPANVAKMASGVGLDDADRQPWLATLAALLASLRAAAVAPAPASAPADGAAGGGGALPPPPPPAAVASLHTVPLVVGVLACSALKVAYRRALEGAPPRRRRPRRRHGRVGGPRRAGGDTGRPRHRTAVCVWPLDGGVYGGRPADRLGAVDAGGGSGVGGDSRRRRRRRGWGGRGGIVGHGHVAAVGGGGG